MLPATYRQALTSRRFRLLALGFGISSLGDGMSALAVAWLAIEISPPTSRGLVVGASVAAYTLPGALGIFMRRFLGPLDSGRLLILNCFLRAICLGAIAVLAYLGRLEVAEYVVLLAGSALLASWGTAARYALVAEALPDSALLGGNSLIGALLNLGIIAGPAVAGLIALAVGAGPVLALDALSWLVYAGCVVLAQEPGASSAVVAPTTSTESGLRMIFRDRTLLGLLILTLAFFFFYGPVEVALPIFVKQNLHGSAALLGAFWTCFGVGAVTGGLAFGVIRRAPLFTAALVIIAGWGLTLAVIPFANVVIGIAAFTAGGLIWAPYPTLVTTLLQQHASGRALTTLSSAWTSATMLATPLGTAIGGPLVAWAGPGQALFVSAVATLAILPFAVIARRS